jgi:hypothetical protein
MAPERTELKWMYEPVNLFETEYESARGGAKLRVSEGEAVVTVPGPKPDVATERELRKWVEAVLKVRGLQASRAATLAEDPAIIEFENGRRNIFVRARAGVFVVDAGQVDMIHTDAGGQMIRDTKTERRAVHRAELDDLSAKAEKSPILGHLLDSFTAALREPAVEFVRIYEIRDALSVLYGSEREAKRKLGISNSDWSEFGRLANDAPVLEGRHNGKHAEALRPATSEERATMRRLAEDWIRKFATGL